MLKECIQDMAASRHLTPQQVAGAIADLVEESVPVELKAGFLSALALKGETVEEIAAFAAELRQRSVTPAIDPRLRSREILDVVGTGGDRLSTFNISTTVAFVVSACGVRVAKHGNRSVSSACGSADVLEALGVCLDVTTETVERCIGAQQ